MEDFSITRDITPGVEITMSEESFSAMMDEFTDVTKEEYRYYQYMLKVEGQGWLNRMLNIRDRALREGRLRDQNPTLQAAWEQYQILLNLLDN
jgi:hypothetical protein